MYARYIPPPKVTAVPPAPSAPPSLEDRQNVPTAPVTAVPPAPSAPPSLEDRQNVPTAPVTASAVPYSRYIPRAKPNPQKTSPQVPKRIVFGFEEEETEPSIIKKRKLEDANGQPADFKEKRPKKAKRLQDDNDDKALKIESHAVRESGSQTTDNLGLDLGKHDRKENNKRKKRKPAVPEDTEVDHGGNGAVNSSIVAEYDRTDDDAIEEGKRRERKAKKGRKERTSEGEGRTTGTPLESNMDGITERHKSILRKKEKSIQKAGKEQATTQQEDQTQTPGEADEQPVEVHGLEPLPQPTPVEEDTSRPDYETLPAWLVAPIRVTPSTRSSFADLGVSPEASKALQDRGYSEAFAVQTAAIPLLMPAADRQGDLVISAATGSGKTLAYVLPMIRDISEGVVTRLRGLIVVPTRELVRQAQEACEVCCSAFSGSGRKRVKVGVSMGSQAFAQEQAALMEEDHKYDPAGYQDFLRKRGRLATWDALDSDSDEDMFEKTSRPLPGHVIDHISKVDVLICTPGRLVEHINLTPGFSLDYVRWLVIDEADKLLAQSFQQWLDTVTERLKVDRLGARDFPTSNKSGVRKVVLSATMTRDLSLLNSLQLQRPKLVVLEGSKGDEEGHRHKTEHALPELLRESAIKIRDPNLKPLYLVGLLGSNHMTAKKPENGTAAAADESDATSSSGSYTDSDSGEESEAESPTAGEQIKSSRSFPTTVLIFTKSNETALRLSRLISILAPHLSRLVGTLASTTRTSQRRKTLRAFATGRTRILVASDLVARGIDLPNLDHVVNYDMPTSVASYVHRVGRTARAGRTGHAWTFYTKSEAGWFWPEVAGQTKGKVANVAIARSGKVEDVRLEADGGGKFSEERVAQYEAALEQLGQEAVEMRRRR